MKHPLVWTVHCELILISQSQGLLWKCHQYLCLRLVENMKIGQPLQIFSMLY